MAFSFVYDGLQALMLDVMLEFFEHILDQGCKYIFFGHKDKVYVIN